MRKLTNDAGLSERVIVDSAGTHDYFIGEPPDPRALAAAQRRGYDLTPLRARQVAPADFEMFDLILAMDFNNIAHLHDVCTGAHRAKIGLLMHYARTRRVSIVHDPYQRNAKDFDCVLDYIEDACRGLVMAISSGEDKQFMQTSGQTSGALPLIN